MRHNPRQGLKIGIIGNVWQPCSSARNQTRRGSKRHRQLSAFGILFSHRMSDVTLLLQAAGRGDDRALEDLLPMVYEELRNLAAAN